MGMFRREGTSAGPSHMGLLSPDTAEIKSKHQMFEV